MKIGQDVQNKVSGSGIDIDIEQHVVPLESFSLGKMVFASSNSCPKVLCCRFLGGVLWEYGLDCEFWKIGDERGRI